jgi:plastocyanin
MRSPVPRFARLPLVALTLAAACGGGGDGPSTSPGPAVATVNVTLASATLDAGATTQAQATPMDASGRTVSGRTATWSSSATSIATVDAGSGLVTGRGAGTAQITATVDGRAGSATVTVRATPQAAALVWMLPAAYAPPFVTIKVGQSVAWDFAGSLDHNVIFQPRTGAPADITPRRSGVVTRQFNTAGTFPYVCTLHAGMIGEVTVEP